MFSRAWAARFCSARRRIYCGLAERSFVAAASIVIRSGAAPTSAIDLGAIRALLATEPVLRRAALRPEAAAIVERNARPSWSARLAMLAAAQPADLDTLSRAVALLAPRVDARKGPWPDTIEVTARMPSGPDAAAVATAVAEALVEDIDETAASARKRGVEQRADRLDRAARRLEEARARAQALRASDPLPTATMPKAPETSDQGAAADRLPARRERGRSAICRSRPHLWPAPSAIDRTRERSSPRQSRARRRRPAGAFEKRCARAACRRRRPGPRAAELAAAEQEATRAESAYDIELSRNETDRREARVLKAAPVPALSNGPPGGAVIAGAALAGFALLGIAPGLRARGRPRMPVTRDRRLGAVRGGVLGAAGY